MSRRIVITATALAWMSGCGGDTDPGSGSNTIKAVVLVEADSGRTQAEVLLNAPNGNPILGANVVFVDREKDENLTAEMPQAGNYRVTVNRYVQKLGLRIVAADDELQARLLGPAPHVITRPPVGAIVRRGDFESIKIDWESEQKAEAVRIRLAGEDVELSGDNGSGDVPLTNVPDGANTVVVIRSTSVELAGGLDGSEMTISYEASADFSLE